MGLAPVDRLNSFQSASRRTSPAPFRDALSNGLMGRAALSCPERFFRALSLPLLSASLAQALASPCLAAQVELPVSGPSWALAGGLAFAAALAAFLAGRSSRTRGESPEKREPSRIQDPVQPPPAKPRTLPEAQPADGGPAAETGLVLAEAEEIGRFGFFNHDLQTGLLEASPFLRELFGFGRNAPLSFGDYEKRIHPDDRSRVKEAREKALSGGAAFYDLQYRVSPGSRVVLKVSARVRIVRDDSGRPVRIFGVISDVTEREEVESQLRISQELFRQYMENAPSAVILAAPQGLIKDASPSAERLLRYSREELTKLALLDLFPENFLEDARRMLRELASRGQVSGKVPFRTSEGKIGWGRCDAVSLAQGTSMVFLTDMTPEHEVQEALLRSEEAFKRLAENLPTLVFRVSEDLRMVYLNPATGKFFGKTAEELQRRTLTETGMPADFIRQWIEPLKNVFRTGQEQRLEIKLDTGASVRCLQAALVPEKAEMGMTRTVLAVSTDISEIKRQEIRTQQQRDFLDALIRNAGEGIAVFDATGRFLVFNPAMEAMTGWKLEELQPPAISYSFSRAEDTAVAMTGILKALEGVDSEEERILPCRGDIVKTVMVSSSPLSANPESLTLVIVRDVSEQKRSTEALARERAYLDMLFENAPDGMVVTDFTGQVLRVNRRFSEMFGFERHEVLGHRIDGLVTRGAYAREAMNLVRQVTAGRPVSLETERVRRDGSSFPCRVIGIPIRLEGGDVHIYALFHDLTEIRQREAELRLANEVVKSSPVILFRWGKELGSPVKYVSENIRLWGYEPDEFSSGKVAYTELMHPEDRIRAIDEVNAFTEKGKDEFLQDYRIVKKNGEIIWVNDQTRIVRDQGGGIEFYQGVVLDITEKKRFELLLEENYRTMRRAWDETIEVLSTTVEMRRSLHRGTPAAGSQAGRCHFREDGYPGTVPFCRGKGVAPP